MDVSASLGLLPVRPRVTATGSCCKTGQKKKSLYTSSLKHSPVLAPPLCILLPEGPPHNVQRLRGCSPCIQHLPCPWPCARPCAGAGIPAPLALGFTATSSSPPHACCCSSGWDTNPKGKPPSGGAKTRCPYGLRWPLGVSRTRAAGGASPWGGEGKRAAFQPGSQLVALCLIRKGQMPANQTAWRHPPGAPHPASAVRDEGQGWSRRPSRPRSSRGAAWGWRPPLALAGAG